MIMLHHKVQLSRYPTQSLGFDFSKKIFEKLLFSAHQLTPVIEAVSYEAESQQMEITEAESQENINPKR